MPREQVHAQTQPGKDAAERTADDDAVDQAVADAQQRAAELEATDSLLDEIDDLLEVNAEEFVRAYVQKGGQAARVILDRLAGGFATIPWRWAP